MLDDKSTQDKKSGQNSQGHLEQRYLLIQMYKVKYVHQNTKRSQLKN